MKNKKTKICMILLLGLGLTAANAQQAIIASGGIASGSGGSASYSIGQIVYKTAYGPNGSVAPGVQQPYEISGAVGVEEAIETNLDLSVYPNPAMDMLTLKVDNLELSALSFQLLDMTGKLIVNEKITGYETNIPMYYFKPATYFLKVNQNTKEIKSFKIIKN